MKKILLGIVLNTLMLFSWEVNTHRAIDRTAIEKSNNLIDFLSDTDSCRCSYLKIQPN